MSSDPAGRFLPLSPATLHILLALADEERHGYAIMQAIRSHSKGEYKIGPGTLYDNLQKLMDQFLVEESARARPAEDSRRRYYRLTRLGRNVLAEELNRLEQVVRQGKLLLNPAAGRRN
jgi:DNA-binding PadR family transcriptional regulator